jgi:hypothetical protein
MLRVQGEASAQVPERCQSGEKPVHGRTVLADPLPRFNRSWRPQHKVGDNRIEIASSDSGTSRSMIAVKVERR